VSCPAASPASRPAAIAGRTLIASWTPGIPAVSPGLVLGGAVLMVVVAILAAWLVALRR
jgi:hypothetical protein